jgi:ankyrin repeat protein
MNKFIQAIKDLNPGLVNELIAKDPAWIKWQEEDGKNALHYLCAVTTANDASRIDASFQILKLLLKSGMDINSPQRIPDKKCGFFPATPLWYAYTRGRNEKIFKYLLLNGANPNHCMFAIAWYDDTESAALFKKYGADIDDHPGSDTPFLAAFNWKRYKVAEWFLKNGADVNAADDNGNTALFYAVKRKLKDEQIQLLLKYSANINKKNNVGVSPKEFAESNRQRKILALLQVNK